MHFFVCTVIHVLTHVSSGQLIYSVVVHTLAALPSRTSKVSQMQLSTHTNSLTLLESKVKAEHSQIVNVTLPCTQP